MLKTSAEYRKDARMALRGHWGIAIVVTLLWTLIYTAISASIILALILGGALMVGLARAFIRLYRYGDMHVEDMFYGFYNGRFTNTISMYLQIILYTFLWSLLFVIPGIIAAYRYSMAHYILMDHPEMTGSEAIEASKALMTGRKWKLFCLQFSFIGFTSGSPPMRPWPRLPSTTPSPTRSAGWIERRQPVKIPTITRMIPDFDRDFTL